ncbi:DNA polymerase III subunit alpha [Gallicola sp. Sow4_E12]|uniref:DNA polymerase III subunit alpha n=1 Tax=Gallicola sp. Sow4_E12 TaxID=3438785 RepID=UPI003F8E4483
MVQFTHLHVHTAYSLLDGYSPIPELLDRCQELGMKNIAITDHGSMFGVVQFYKEAVKRGIKPILGCEIYTVNGDYLEKSAQNKRYNHLILLAKDQEGYENLMKIVSLGYIKGFYYKPRVDYSVLRKYHKGIIALSACLKGKVQEDLVFKNDYETAKESAIELQEIFGEDNFYLELQNHGMREDERILEEIPRISSETGIPLVATNDIHYVNKDDWKIHDIILAIQMGTTLEQKNSEGKMQYAPGEFYLRSPEEMENLFGDYKEALTNTEKIAERCNVELEFGNLHLPYFEIPKEHTNVSYLRELTKSGLENRYEKITEEIQERAEFELQTIEKMGYVDYFLIVWDFIRFAKEEKIPVGPGRGSAAGSIVSFALGITDIDPLDYDLLFERFLNPERVSMPDIDIDFCYERRDEVIQYVVKKYGAEKVAQIVTFGTMGARGAIRDVGRVLDMDYKKVDEIAKQIPMQLDMTISKALEISNEFKNSYESNPETRRLIDIALRVEGTPRHTSTHAAGVVISRKPIMEYVSLAKNKDAIITQCNMTELEELGLLKMDFLGLRTLTVIQDAVDMINEKEGNLLKVEDMDENDSEVLSMFTVAETLGIFQFESSGMRNFLKELKPTRFNDLIAANSLFRPGPMNEIPTYIHNKNHPEDIKYLHPALKPILSETYGTIVYQEQVMQIVQQLAGFSLGQADNLRRAMGKKKMDVMEAERKRFIYGEDGADGEILVEGTLRKGISAEIANEIYDLMIDFAKYAFNKSHSAAYSLVAMRTAWLKHYYPLEFMAALMSSVMGNTPQISLYIQESRRLDLAILPPDVNYSNKKFTVQNEAIRFGMMAIKNVGGALIEAIVKARQAGGLFTDFREFVERVTAVDSTALNKRGMESLIKAGAFSSLGYTRSGLMLEYSAVIDSVQNTAKKNVPGQKSLFDIMEEDGPKPVSEIQYKNHQEYNKKDLLKFEKEVLGVYLTDHPLRPYEEWINKYSNFTMIDLKEEISLAEAKWDQKEVTMVGIVESVNKKFTRNNQLMEFVKFEDLYGMIELIVFPKLYDRYSSLMIEDQVLMVKGRLSLSEMEEPKLIVDKVEELDKNLPSEKIYIKITPSIESQTVEDIKIFLRSYTGEQKSPIQFYFSHSGKSFVLKKEMWADAEDENLIKELEKRLGKQNVKVV